MKTKVIPIFLYEIQIGNVEINNSYIDILECNQINLDIEYRKSTNGGSLFLIDVNKEKKVI